MTGGQFSVVGSELTAAAGDIRTAVAPVACYHFAPTSVSGASFGHTEVADLFGQLCARLDSAVSALARVGDDMATGLDATAKAYADADQQQCVVYSGAPVGAGRAR